VRYPALPLGPAIGARNALSHGYFEVKLDRVWATIKEDLPDLKAKVAEALSRLRDGATGAPEA
jgi:uncharacterized protein with HEPN domain